MRAWKKIDASWYTLSPAAGICREQDGRWHVYISKDEYPGDCDFATLRAAQKYVAETLPEEPLSPATYALEGLCDDGWVTISRHASRAAATAAAAKIRAGGVPAYSRLRLALIAWEAV